MDHLSSIPSSAFELILTLPFPLSLMTSLQSCFPLKYISEQFLFINLYTSHFWKITKPQDFFLIPHLSHSFSVSSANCCQPTPNMTWSFPLSPTALQGFSAVVYIEWPPPLARSSGRQPTQQSSLLFFPHSYLPSLTNSWSLHILTVRLLLLPKKKSTGSTVRQPRLESQHW